MDMMDSHIALRFAEVLREDFGETRGQGLGGSHGFLLRFLPFVSLFPRLSNLQDLSYLIFLKTSDQDSVVYDYCGIGEASSTT